VKHGKQPTFFSLSILIRIETHNKSYEQK